MEKIFLHADLDAFFASVEQLDHPEYRGKPVIVSGLPGDRRCVVSTASYEARKFGVHSAMPAKTAFQLCPNGIFVRPNMKRYHEKSHEVMSIFRQYSPDVIQMSVDEAFIDLTGTERLLGPAEETARRIKQQVKEETGLTISIGMASTMYLAKIASGYRKPDGLTIIKPGDEEKFMLSLPLNKLWGAGEKTLDRLRKAGFRTTQQIYNKSEGLLQGIFGENTGSFLYNSVRGNKDLIFGQEAENHSISSEKTFEYDLTDRDAIETALLQLSHTVMFRLHRENVYSRTLALKIRYDDFTTVSIQQTGERNFSSVDDLFERCCILFYKKYNKESGIRLLGVAADKVEDNSIPSQKELFDFGEEKKSKIEKTIMNLEDKMPGIKIQKARTLHKALLFIPLALFLASGISPVHAEDMNESEETTQTDDEIVFFREKNNLFELKAKGIWEAEINTGIGSNFGNGKAFSTSFISPVFTQKVDLSLTAQFSKQFYFEGKFSDSFEKNSIAAVYKSDGFLKELRIANRGIVFPKSYSVTDTGYSIGGGNNLAPGIHAHFEKNKFISDAVIRYEMLSQKSKTFYGLNSVTSVQIAPQDYIRGKEFVLADEKQILDIESIYVESPDGIHSDAGGRKYRKLPASEYILNAARKTISFTEEACTYYDSTNLPAVIITFKSLSKSQINAQLGSDSSTWNGNTFLGKIQEYFNKNSNGSSKIIISSYTFDLFTQIENKDALVLQKGAYFSPFAVCCKYDAGYALSSDAVVINSHSKSKTDSYTVSTYSDEDSRLYLTVRNCDTEDYTLPEYRYPFAADENGYYLNGIISSDFAVEARIYSEVANYYIGTNAAEGTISVYINELPDEGAVYSSETGIVTPSRIINSQDKVYITWSEDNETSSYGSIAFGTAFKYKFTESFSTDISLTGRWSLPGNNSFATSVDSYPGFAAITAGLSYKNNFFHAENTFTASVENENTTGLYRLLSMDDSSEKENYLSEDAAVSIPRDKDISLNDRINSSSFSILKKEYNCSSTANKIVSDSEINGYTVPVEWDFSSAKNGNASDYAWAAKTIDLGSYADTLCTGNQFSIALYSPSFSKDTYVFLQLGVNINENTFTEDIYSIPTWCLTADEDGRKSDGVIYGFSSESNSFAKPLSTKWQQITVQLTDRDRARLIENKGARIIAIKSISLLNDSSDSNKGIIYAGPWSVTGSSFSSEYDSTMLSVRSFQYDRTAEEGTLPDDEIISNFNKGIENSVQSFRWNTVLPKEDFSDGSNIITLKKYFDSVSIDSYRKLNFYFKYNPFAAEKNTSADFADDGIITINLYSEKYGSTVPAVHLEIYSSQAEILKGNDWHKTEINFEENCLIIDEKKLESDKYTLSVNRYDSVSSLEIKLNILSKSSGNIYRSGIFETDEFYLSNTDTEFTGKDRLKAGYVNKTNPLTVNGRVLLGNIDFGIDATGVSSRKISSDESRDLSAKGNVKLSFDSLNLSYGINTEINYSSNQKQNATVTENTKYITGLSLFNYSVKTISPLFKTISFSTDFTSNIISAQDSASSAINISLSQIRIPLQINFETKSSSSLWSVIQNSSSTINFNSKHYSFSTQASVSQKAPSSYSYQTLDKSFLSIQKNAFSTGRHDASLRTESILIKNSFNFADGTVKPSFTVKGNAQKEETFIDSLSAVFEIPVKIGSQTFSFGTERLSSAENKYSSGIRKESAYVQDIFFASENISTRSWFWKTLPAADLFTKEINVSGNNYTEKNIANYYLSWSKPISYKYTDLFIPNGTSVSFARETVSSTSVSDYYLLKLQTIFSALNLFGKYGSTSLFNWYEQDYFSTILTSSLKIPKDNTKEFTPVFSINIDDSFYLPFDGILEFTFDTYYEKNSSFNINSFITFNRKAESSPLILLIALFTDKIKPSSIPLTRKNILSYQFIKAQDNSITNTKIYRQHKASISNSLEARINKFFTLTTTASCSYTVSDNENMYCSILFALGGKLNF